MFTGQGWREKTVSRSQKMQLYCGSGAAMLAGRSWMQMLRSSRLMLSVWRHRGYYCLSSCGRVLLDWQKFNFTEYSPPSSVLRVERPGLRREVLLSPLHLQWLFATALFRMPQDDPRGCQASDRPNGSQGGSFSGACRPKQDPTTGRWPVKSKLGSTGHTQAAAEDQFSSVLAKSIHVGHLEFDIDDLKLWSH